MQNRFCAQLRLAILGAALTGIFVAPSARADIEYNLTNLGALGGTYSIPYAINNSGQIVGVASVANGDNHAFLYQNGSMVDLGTLGGTFSGAQAINNLGVVVGTSTDSTGQSHGFMYSSGIMSALPSLPNTTIISVNGVNDLGQMVGAFRSSDTVDYPNAAGGQAFVYSGGVVTPIPAVGFNSSAFAINRTGIVVGRISNTIGDPQAAGLEFRYENGQLSTVPPNILGGSANAINDAGQIAGTYGYPNYGSRAFIWQGDSATFITSQMDEAIALGINNLGQVVGIMDGYAFIYKNGTDTLLPYLVSPTGNSRLIAATGINDLGQIIGYSQDPDATRHAFLLTPTPEPGTIGVIALACFSLLARRRPHAST